MFESWNKALLGLLSSTIELLKFTESLLRCSYDYMGFVESANIAGLLLIVVSKVDD